MQNNQFGFPGNEWLTPEFVERRVRDRLEAAGIQPDIGLRLLRRTDSIISGSTPIPILVNLPFKPNDLDMYITKPQQRTVLGVLTTDLGFVVFRRTNDDYVVGFGIAHILWLRKNHHVINVLVVSGDNAVESIFHFHSTIVMNFISGYGVFCAYPALTLRKRSVTNHSILSDQTSTNRARTCFEKYERRGICHKDHLRHHVNWLGHRDHVDWSAHICGTDKACPSTFRTLHDDGSLFIPFPSTTTPASPPVIFNGVDSVVWSLGGSSCSPLPVGHESFVQTIPVTFLKVTTS
ncbi:hypothetical protein R3P38DRAFT_2584591 [Favolaschia claudopus]|uniref:Uncharacterized protein n=1 Tax=Favolaschia claudopus TaxID=2862362 RepID=A0AAV9Z7Q5_9AGAR